jgi:hypothetical protein
VPAASHFPLQSGCLIEEIASPRTGHDVIL